MKPKLMNGGGLEMGGGGGSNARFPGVRQRMWEDFQQQAGRNSPPPPAEKPRRATLAELQEAAQKPLPPLTEKEQDMLEIAKHLQEEGKKRLAGARALHAKPADPQKP